MRFYLNSHTAIFVHCSFGWYCAVLRRGVQRKARSIERGGRVADCGNGMVQTLISEKEKSEKKKFFRKEKRKNEKRKNGESRDERVSNGGGVSDRG